MGTPHTLVFGTFATASTVAAAASNTLQFCSDSRSSFKI